MKVIKLVTIFFGILGILSCKNSEKNEQYASEPEDQTMNKETTAVEPDVDNTIDSEGTIIIDDQLALYSAENLEELYELLDMSEEQIDRFENDFHTNMDRMAADSTLSLDDANLQPKMDQSLQAVLTSDQYEKYKVWKKEHGHR